MRRYILLFIVLCLHVAARGQTVLDDLDLSWLPQPTQAKALRYWIDDDIGSLQTTNSLSGQHTVDVSSLFDGLHTIHYQIIDSEDKVAAPYSRIFLKMNESTDISSTAATLRYWFDDDTNVSVCDANMGTLVLDVSTLFDGLHTLHYQVVDTEGKVSYIASAIFLKMEATQGSSNVTAERLIYWFDDEESTTSVEMISGVMSLDASNLSDGLHTIHYLVTCSDGSVTSAYSSIFLRMNIDIISTTAQSLRYWFDDETDVTVTEIAQGTQTLDASLLSDGLHTVHYQVVDNSGAVTAPASGMFLKFEHGNEAVTTAQSLRYWFDDETDVKIINVASGTQTLDVSDLLAGLHTLHYQIVDSKGQLASTYSGIFLKMFDKPVEDGQNGITKYQYWLNDNSKAMQTVTLDEATNPYTLIALLPIQKEPFRSSCFHFENKDSKPMMYAKNDFHIRFHDAANYWADESRQFIDYSISREVKPVGELQTKQTFEKVAENDVRWYTVQVAPGDTTAFRLSQPATIQLFAPSGQEVFKTSESASVQWDGIHTWEDGTYYLAVHDVTGSQSTMKLEYMHMDKYDVVDWDVHTVGNGGCSTITFKGNGFRDLYAVDLVVAPGDTVHSVAVNHNSDAETAVTFDFTDATFGGYNAVFHFTEEDKHFANVVTVEEAKEIELALNVTCPSSFLRGTATTYTVTVTNKGNTTAYDVPMEIYLSAGNSFSNIQSVKFKDEYGKEFNNFTMDEIDKDSIDVETMAYMEGLLQELNGLQSFIVKNDSTYGGEYGFTDQLVTVPPMSSTTFYVEIKSSSSVRLHARIPSEWITIFSASKDVNAATRRKSASDSNLCCEKEKWECTVGIIADIIGLVPVAGCGSALVDLGTFTVFEIACADGNSLGSKELDFYQSLINNKKKRESAINKVINGLLGCISGAIGRSIKAINDKLKPARKARQAALDAAKIARDERAKSLQSWKYLKDKGDEAYAAGRIDEAKNFWESSDEAWSNAEKFLKEAEAKDREAATLLETINNLEKDLFKQQDLFKNFIDKLKDRFGNSIANLQNNSECIQAWKQAEANCPPDPEDDDDTSNPYTPSDPNDIFGYLSQAGSKFIADSVARVNYTIEFENDTTFATAAAHTIIIKDTLDNRYFDLSKFMPTGIRIGEHEAFLDEADVLIKNNVTSFVKTIDMRPEINAIAQVDGTFSHTTGVAEWRFTSLDPMTMEPTDDLMQGILPVNYNGTSGIGEVMFEIGVKQGKADGTELKNRAGIVFDYEEAILTPTWTNIVDAVAPSSVIDNSWMANDSTLHVTADASDGRSGVWKYEWYVQAGENAPWWKEGETYSNSFDYHIYEGIDYGFCVLVTDSAGNVEQKVIERERGFKTYGPDYEDTIEEVPATTIETGDAYDVSGRKVGRKAKGVIIRHSDGTTRKVMIK